MVQYQIPRVRTFEFTKIVGLEKIEFGKDVIIDDFVFIYAKKRIIIGNNVHIACFTSITGGEALEMGDFSGISQGCRILTGTEDFKEWGFGNPTISEKYRNVRQAPISIGRFCIVGANSVVLPGVTIGEGAMVGACSVVSSDLDPWGIYIGNKKIHDRNRDAVLKTYEAFLTDTQHEKSE
ncbi:MAG TPA: acyltransferase [Thermodesulfovibrionales bacterium]|jgi:galactoside O-acetyltransferase|nr:acyltransferase [Thermodesulfovibrionales bacterium]